MKRGKVLLEGRGEVGGSLRLMGRGVVLRSSLMSGHPIPRTGAGGAFRDPPLSFGLGAYYLGTKVPFLHVSVHPGCCLGVSRPLISMMITPRFTFVLINLRCFFPVVGWG